MYLQIQQLNKSYGSRRVVSDVDLTMAGEGRDTLSSGAIGLWKNDHFAHVGGSGITG